MSFMTGHIVAANGTSSLFSVCFENGRTGDHGSNTLVFVADPKFASPPGSLPLEQRQVPTTLPPSLLIAVQQRQVPTTLPPSLITVPAADQAAARAPPLLKETIPKEALAGTIPTIAVPAAAQAAARAPPSLEETIPEELLAGTIPTVAPDPELAGIMPPLIPMVPQDDDAASSVASMLPVLGTANWENLNADDDNKEDQHENDVVEEVGKDVHIHP
jgi:hypothetical protein